MDTATTDRELINAARALRYEDPARWRQFVAEHPELADLVKLTRREPDSTIGSPKKYAPGKFWPSVDKERRIRRSRPRPTSDMTMQDGSPLRVPAPGDVDIDGDALAAVVPHAMRQVCEDDGGNVYLSLFDGVHGEGEPNPKPSRQDRAHHRQLEHCLLCGHLIPLTWPEPKCEFPNAPMPDGQHCHCNGCLRSPERGKGRPRYCSARCADRMDNAMDRARLRAAGANSRKFDPDADRIAQFRVDMRDRARRTKADDVRYRFDWTGVWHVPTRLEHQVCHRVDNTQPNVWQITLTNERNDGWWTTNT